MEYTVENLEQAVAIFYRAEANQQAEAHEWLTQAQISPHAWDFVWELLHPQRSFQVQFFAATTLHRKLMSNWNEVPVVHYEALKKRILETIINYAMGPKMVLNRLCIAFSAYIIHTLPSHWPNAFEELVSNFQPQNLPTIESDRVIWILLEILTVIPEEFQTTLLTVTQRNQIRAVLQNVSKDIMRVVGMCLVSIPSKGFDMNNLTTYLHCTKCSLSWIALGGLNIQECESFCNLLIDLCCFCYWNRGDQECFLAEEFDLIETIVELLTVVIQQPSTVKYKQLVTKLLGNILFKFEQIIETEIKSEELNKDILNCLYGLLVVFGDAHIHLIIDNFKSPNTEERSISAGLLNSILKCTNLPGRYPVDESCSNLTFGFWYSLQEDILELEAPESTQLLLMVKPYYRHLIYILLNKSMLNEEMKWTLDDKEFFRCYRQDISDTYAICYNVLNLEMLDIISTKLDEALHRHNGIDSTRALRWVEIETCLYAFCAIAESIAMENLYLPKLMVTIKEIPYQDLNIKVMKTALETVGAYSEWLSHHPELLENIFPLVVASLGNPEISVSVTMALKDLTCSCQKHLLPYVDQILITSQAILERDNLKLAECRRLMYSIGRVLSIMPVGRVMEYLNVILSPMMDEFQKLVEKAPSAQNATALMTKLRILTSLINSLYIEPSTPKERIEQPVFVIMKNLLPPCRIIAEKYCNDNDLINDISEIFKGAIITLKDESRPLNEEILRTVITIYSLNPQPHILNVVRVAILMFNTDKEFQTLNKELVKSICDKTIEMCIQYNNDSQLILIMELLEGFYLLLTNLLKKATHLIFNNEIDTSILFQWAIMCLVFPEVQITKAVSYYIVTYISKSKDMSQLSVIQTYGESLVLRILLNLGTSSPRTSIERLSDIILILNKTNSNYLYSWLKNLLAQENFPTPRVTTQEKETFMKSVLKEKSSKKRILDIVLEFSLICKGIIMPQDPLLVN